MTLNELETLSDIYVIPQVSVDFIRDSYVNIPTKQMDNVRYVLINCTENGIVKKISTSWESHIRLKKSDNNIVYNNCDIIEETGQILVTLTEQILAASGKAKADIQFITDENMIYSTKLFYLDIGEIPYASDEVVSSYEFDVLNQSLLKVNQSIEITEEIAQKAKEWEVAENIRQENETQRIENENIRSKTFQDLQTDMELEITNVQNATNNAQEASSNVSQAITSANLATSQITELSASISNAEELRQNNESTRIENENERINNENARISAENTRQENNTNALTELSNATLDANTQIERLTNINNDAEQSEILRKEAENIRIQSENSRIQAEILREQNTTNALESISNSIIDSDNKIKEIESLNESMINAENSRVSAETERIEKFSTIIDESNTSIQKANDVIDSITLTEENIINSENERIEEFNSLKSQINSAIEVSNVSTNNANIATESAISASNTAISSANRANELIDTLETSIENSESATNRANIAAENCENIISGTGFISLTEKGNTNGVATLNENGKIPTSQLPSYVDDVIEGSINSDKNEFINTDGEICVPEGSKIYIDTESNITYRWSGTIFVPIGSDLALGETDSSAYRGDRGKEAYDHSQTIHARTDATKTEKSSINGNIKIDETEVNIYTLPVANDSTLGGVRSSMTGVTANRDYNVQINSDGTMKVNVPWIDNDTIYTHPTSPGNNHIPTGGETGQVLGWSADGEASWINLSSKDIGSADNMEFDELNSELQLKSGTDILSRVTIQCSTFLISDVEPTTTNVLWIDSNGVQRYYNGTEWTPIRAVWG